jgi:hypothetical protein
LHVDCQLPASLVLTVLHPAIDDLGPGRFMARVGPVVEAIEQSRDQLGALLYESFRTSSMTASIATVSV